MNGTVDPATVMALSGHGNVETTMKFYAAVTDEQREKARRAAAAAIGDPQGTQIDRSPAEILISDRARQDLNLRPSD